MPQLEPAGGDDLGAPDELIAFQDEGEEQDKGAGRGSAHGDLDELKSSLVSETENRGTGGGTGGGSDSEAERPPQPRESFQKPRDYLAEVVRRQQDGGFFKGPPYPGYPFLMLPELSSPYLANGALSPGGARTYLQMKWPLLDVPAGATLKDSRSPSPAHLSNKVPVVQHAHHMHPLTPLITYSNDHFSPGSPPGHLSPEIDPKTGIPRPPHPSELPPYYPLSPGAVGQIPHPLGWLVPQQGQPVYSIPPGGFRHPYPALAMNASMSSLMSSRFSPHMVPPPTHGLHPSGIPHPTIVSPIVKQEPTQPSVSPGGNSKSPVTVKKEEEKKPHIKKPLNAFMLYMKEMRAKVVAECTLKESAAINQILGRRWHSLSREEQAKYYELARKERQLHSQLYPTWSARDNYGKKKKRKREKLAQQQSHDTESEYPPASLLPPQASVAHAVLLHPSQAPWRPRARSRVCSTCRPRNRATAPHPPTAACWIRPPRRRPPWRPRPPRLPPTRNRLSPSRSPPSRRRGLSSPSTRPPSSRAKPPLLPPPPPPLPPPQASAARPRSSPDPSPSPRCPPRLSCPRLHPSRPPSRPRRLPWPCCRRSPFPWSPNLLTKGKNSSPLVPSRPIHPLPAVHCRSHNQDSNAAKTIIGQYLTLSELFCKQTLEEGAFCSELLPAVDLKTIFIKKKEKKKKKKKRNPPQAANNGNLPRADHGHEPSARRCRRAR